MDLDWGRTTHAYGPAVATPGHLRDLTAVEPAARARALRHLYHEVCHRQTIHPATGPMVEAVAGILADDRLGVPDPDAGRSMRASLLALLGEVGAWCGGYASESESTMLAIRRDDPEAAAFPEVWDDFEGDPAILIAGPVQAACVRRAPAVLAALTPWLDADDPHERGRARYAAACWAALGPPVPEPVIARLREIATGDGCRDVRVDSVLGLAGAGVDTGVLLDDPDRLIRTCAALSPAMAGDPRAVALVEAALIDAPDGIRWEPPPPYIAFGLENRLAALAPGWPG
ncbi:hypothetical protein ACWT_3052 [Actinoplanes sp. SE50]|uniref:HEAT repeat domain-containing protein n=1 Tax=unclassified Actinoplanes TaxID=2626549 RepID=UPI00023EC0D2|nr:MULTISPECIES: HEAT repeat domain-containing protein [unclassified Actinoplanes]AEV84075.1 hypothetical protein ACPL_3180 [Actinoplanes sp. SE50/110]ATO82467.1 hypothetical protein ACWT_3052 [Actinoplanes sp. SE50]SLL99874.1 hypothetical protein ACSP50_3106 [Actinoplanes sp. SE50/110]